MALEIEKKYRLTRVQKQNVLRRLKEVRAKHASDEFEENILYGGRAVDLGRAVLRLRRVGERAILTFKRRVPTGSFVKQQQEEETEVSDADALDAILQSLGLVPVLVYEKRRSSWRLGKAEIVVDDLPFGLFMEIEASEKEIEQVEQKLAIKDLKAEHATYPALARKHGKKIGEIIEARFK
jgi:adenylate cyclase class 2